MATTQPIVPVKPAQSSPKSGQTEIEKPASSPAPAKAGDSPKKADKPASISYTYLLRFTIGDMVLTNLKGDFLGTPIIHLNTRQYSEFICTLSDPNGDVWPQIKAREGQEATIEVGYPPDHLYKKITGMAVRIGRSFPVGVIIEILDATAKLNQANNSGIATPQEVPGDSGAAVFASVKSVEPGTLSAANPGGVLPTNQEIKTLANRLSSQQLDDLQPDLDVDLGATVSTNALLKSDQITKQQVDNSKAATGGVEQKPAIAAQVEKAGGKFENRSPTATSKSGTTTLTQPGLKAQTQEAAKQGDVIVAAGDGTVAQVAPGQGKDSGLVLDWKIHQGAFVRPPKITKKTPLQLPSAVTVRGWSLADGQQIGATVVAPTPGTDVNAVVNVPEVGQIKFSDPIFPGCQYTWGDATMNSEVRRPRSKEVAQEIAKIAKVLMELSQKYNGGKKMNVTSWYRPPEINAAFASGPNGPHTKGNAVDFWFDPPAQFNAMFKELDTNWNGGVAKNHAEGWMHIDLGSKRRWNY